jgi:APA family basic amino acid/polyamine antiporter
VGSSIGSGILRVPGEVAAHLPSTELFLACWVIGGVYALLGSVSFAELGTRIPRAGGAYLYARHAFGPFASFVVGWSGWFGGCGSLAAVAIILGEYLSSFFPALHGRVLPIALATLLFFPLLHWRGIRWGSGAQQLTSLIKLVAFSALVIACFAVAIPAAASLAPSPPRPVAPSGIALFIPMMLALQGIIFTYGGWNAPIGFAEEIRNPERNLPRCMFSGVFLVIVVYLGVNLALLHVLPISQLAGQKLAAAAAAQALFGERGERMIQGLAVVSILGVLNAALLGTPRVLLAMGRDGIAPDWATRINRGGTPAPALLATVLSALLFLATGTFARVLAAVVLLGVSIDAACFLALIVLRRREAASRRTDAEPEKRPIYRAWGYPWTTGASLAIALTLVVGVARATPESILYAFLVLAASYPAYRWIERQKRR